MRTRTLVALAGTERVPNRANQGAGGLDQGMEVKGIARINTHNDRQPMH